eukprot:TRINITY_DN4631_c0_g1_i3.p1 TRINITY_DN4631_c0_g1~~TRINITY_DN4631_c0_g1_i3.p1  ORF type:complete len:290 (+),score=61.66 TRINITY_DN4631_c0_g1_i3:115-870(+)
MKVQLALPPDNLPFLAYNIYEQNSGTLKIAKCTKKDCSRVLLSVVDDPSHYGTFAVLFSWHLFAIIETACVACAVLLLYWGRSMGITHFKEDVKTPFLSLIKVESRFLRQVRLLMVAAMLGSLLALLAFIVYFARGILVSWYLCFPCFVTVLCSVLLYAAIRTGRQLAVLASLLFTLLSVLASPLLLTVLVSLVQQPCTLLTTDVLFPACVYVVGITVLMLLMGYAVFLSSRILTMFSLSQPQQYTWPDAD